MQEADIVDGKKTLRDRLPKRTKMAYSLGTAVDMWGLWLYPAVAFAVFNMYLGVSPWLVGLALTLIRIFDAVVDPAMGWLSDNLRSKWGRRRPFILIFGILSGLALPILFLVSPSWVGIKFLGVSVVFWYMMLSTMVYIPIISAFTVPYYSLGAEMSPDYEERTSIMSYRSMAQKVSELGNFYALRFTNLAWFLIPGTGQKNTLLGIQVYTAILGVVMAIFAIVVFFRVKERYYEKVVVKVTEKISILSGLGETLKCMPFRKMMVVGAAFTLGTSMVGSLGYYATVFYVSGGNKIVGDNWQFWMGVAFMAGGLMGVPLHAALAHRIGKRRAIVVACCIGICGYGGSWFLYTPAIQWLQTVASCLMGMAAASLWMLHSSIGADIIDFDELNTGERREGSFTACASYILKLGNSLGYTFSGLILTWAGFTWKLKVQAPETIFWIRFSLATLPIMGLIIAIIFVLSVKLTKQRSGEIRRSLEDRRGTV
ncbi:MAG: MFS transporter [Candidatus Omnitrophica bacterium]|nr:MFS transporter [Candidatus Omnitrophota bacterium]MBU1127882.1 MFS transporter [Candidatus Omnitrophota bacterium]MBU1656771.1 MFS transporter [Candidatus Omnitrophota bacterium]MBU1784483.1 MFS transporter [Candidatus Omnitrophota bacterium]MBU1852002.1 MFS transporter [Candidatus Omnitrophota bacterium]